MSPTHRFKNISIRKILRPFPDQRTQPGLPLEGFQPLYNSKFQGLILSWRPLQGSHSTIYKPLETRIMSLFPNRWLAQGSHPDVCSLLITRNHRSSPGTEGLVETPSWKQARQKIGTRLRYLQMTPPSRAKWKSHWEGLSRVINLLANKETSEEKL